MRNIKPKAILVQEKEKLVTVDILIIEMGISRKNLDYYS
jgi:hypothetical protein